MVTFESTGLVNTEETLKIAVAYAKEHGVLSALREAFNDSEVRRGNIVEKSFKIQNSANQFNIIRNTRQIQKKCHNTVGQKANTNDEQNGYHRLFCFLTFRI